MRGERITVQGQVQGVGFRPTVWRIATELGLTGDVRNTGEGVEIRLFGAISTASPSGSRKKRQRWRASMRSERAPLDGASPEGFAIAPSDDGAARVCVTPDTATCPECLAEIRDPFARRYRYPFANCTNCGPRFSIIDGAPYDRAKTTMRAFAMLRGMPREYESPAERRFHAQPIACHVCGPRASIERLGPGAVHHEAFSMLDDVDAAGGMIMNGHIVAVKGIGGFHLACDATNEAAVLRLRARKKTPLESLRLDGARCRYCQTLLRGFRAGGGAVCAASPRRSSS